jgi:hypothetical protein
MNHVALRCRLLGGILAAGMGALLLAGCHESTLVPDGPTVSLTAAMADPGDPATTDLSQVAIQPANPEDATATLQAPVLTASDGAAITSAGTESSLVIDSGNTGLAAGSLPLRAADGRISGDSMAILPAGDSSIALSDNTWLDIDDPSALSVRGDSQRALRLRTFKVLFTTHKGHPPTWTLPNTHQLHMTRVKRMYMLKGSFLVLRWNGKHAVPPQDGKVTITANLYNGDTKVAGPLVKTAMVQNNTAIFTGNTAVEFNRVGITIDLRDAK